MQSAFETELSRIRHLAEELSSGKEKLVESESKAARFERELSVAKSANADSPECSTIESKSRDQPNYPHPNHAELLAESLQKVKALESQLQIAMDEMEGYKSLACSLEIRLSEVQNESSKESEMSTLSINQLKMDLSVSQEKILKLIDERDAFRGIIGKMEEDNVNRVINAEQELAALQRQAATYESNIALMKSNEDDLVQKAEYLSSSLSLANRELADLASHLKVKEEQMARLNEELVKSREEIQHQNSLVDQITCDLKNAQMLEAKTRTELEEEKQASVHLRHFTEVLGESVERMCERMRELRSEIQGEVNTEALQQFALCSDSAVLEALTNLRNENSSLEKANSDFELRLVQSDQRVKYLEQQELNLAERLKIAEERLNGVMKENADLLNDVKAKNYLKAQCDLAESLNQKLQRSLEDEKQKSIDLEVRLHKLGEDIHAATSISEALKKDLEFANKEVEKVRGLNKKLLEERAKFDPDGVTALRMKLDESEEEISLLRSQVEHSAQNVDNLSKELADTVKQRDGLSSEIAETQKRIRDQGEAIQRVRKVAKKYKMLYDEQVTLRTEAESKLEVMGKEIESSQQECSSVKKENEELRAKLQASISAQQKIEAEAASAPADQETQRVYIICFYWVSEELKFRHDTLSTSHAMCEANLAHLQNRIKSFSLMVSTASSEKASKRGKQTAEAKPSASSSKATPVQLVAAMPATSFAAPLDRFGGQEEPASLTISKVSPRLAPTVASVKPLPSVRL
ncbi:unnamed protein product, partial [Soboliphyme baturini]|uniref:Nucleoprotein TPR n=1 Tax=Soboliphyme baturini TaxID=241478 RepID=A0A183IY63_9BILA